VLDGLRAELELLGLTPFDIQLPGEDSAVAPLDGALRVRTFGRHRIGSQLRALGARADTRSVIL
jgi:hypothetical protein